MDDRIVIEPVDYLVIGHLTVDLTPQGKRLGGTAAYSALTARALGLKVGVVTVWGGEISLSVMENIPVISFPSDQSTMFGNRYADSQRTQYLIQRAGAIEYFQVPESWRSASMVHLGPVAQEIGPGFGRNFPTAWLGVTPQGWLRQWDEQGKISPAEWPEASYVLERAGAAVISVEDVDGDEDRIDEMAAFCHVLAVTENRLGARVYWNGDVRRFHPPLVKEVDPTGAGDVFAAVFFSRLFATHDPWEAGRLATQLSALSVTRPGLEGIPTQNEINSCLVEVF